MKKQNPKQFLLQVLEIIGYENDKEKYADEFLSLCLQQAVINLIPTLPSEKQEEIKSKLSYLKSLTDLEKLLSKYSSDDDYGKAVSNATQSLFQDYLQSIVPTLNQDQKDNLQQYLKSRDSIK